MQEISLTKLMITSFFQQPLFRHMKASHTQLCLRPAISTNIFLALVSKQCEYSKVPFSSKSHHPCRTKSNSKAAVANGLHGVRCPIIFRRPWASEHSHLPAPSCSCVHRLIIPQPQLLFSGQEIRKTRLTEMPLLARKSLIYSRNLKCISSL